jgi:hypothetical protein
MSVPALICGKFQAQNSPELDACTFCGTPLTEQAGAKKAAFGPPKPPSIEEITRARTTHVRRTIRRGAQLARYPFRRFLHFDRV